MRIGTPKLLALLAGAAFLGSATDVRARSELEKGWAAYERGDYELAVKQIRPDAEQCDPEAQFKLRRMYQEGRGVTQDHGEAGKWYRLSADRGQPFAQNEFGDEEIASFPCFSL